MLIVQWREAKAEKNDVNRADGGSIPDINPHDLLMSVNLSKLSKEFYEKIEVKKWYKRKKVSEVLEMLTKNSKLGMVTMVIWFKP